MAMIFEKKYVFSLILALSFVAALVGLEREVTTMNQVFQQGTLISVATYGICTVLVIEFFRRLFIVRGLRKGIAYGLSAFVGSLLGFSLALCLQMMIILFFY